MNLAIAHRSDAIRHALTVVAGGVRGWTVAWLEADPAAAVRRCVEHRPDLLLIESSASAVEATRHIMQATPCAVVVVADRQNRDASTVFEAMSAGAIDVAMAPAVDAAGGLAGHDVVRSLQTIERLLRSRRPSRQPAAPARASAVRPAPPVVAIGASTGGPAAVLEVLRGVSPSTGAAIAVVQHVGAEFCGEMVRWMAGQLSLPVRLATRGERLRPGVVTLAGGSDDVAVAYGLDLAMRRPSRQSFYHPSIDVFFTSLARHWPRPGLGIVLTGIGRDGAEGLLALRGAGWVTVAQDAASSVVYGMPKAAAEIDAADQVLPLDRIGAVVQRFAAAWPSAGGTHA